MLLVMVTIAVVALAFWQKSNFFMLIAGIIAIGFGAYWIANNTGFFYVMEGVASVGIGLYMLINTGVSWFRER